VTISDPVAHGCDRIVVVSGLAVLLRLETEGGRRQLAVAGLCALMALLVALALVVPLLLRALNPHRAKRPLPWAIGGIIGVGTMLGVFRLLRV
jgi:hypothetical protein